jgi:hypothetical protein
VPRPNQAGRTERDCVHEKTHGIARKSSIRAVALRRAGREPSRRRETSRTGVAAWKKSAKSGSP